VSVITLLRGSIVALTAAGVAAMGVSRASAEALLLVEADSGKVLFAENATYPWYPASLTKLMTAYVLLHAVKEGRLTLDSLLTVSQFASVQKPAKMGLKPGPLYRKILDRLLDARLNGEVKTDADEREMAKRMANL